MTLLLEKDDHNHKDKGVAWCREQTLVGTSKVHPTGKFEIVTELWPSAALFSF